MDVTHPVAISVENSLVRMFELAAKNRVLHMSAESPDHSSCRSVVFGNSDLNVAVCLSASRTASAGRELRNPVPFSRSGGKLFSLPKHFIPFTSLGATA
jgi:hypothetical protein